MRDTLPVVYLARHGGTAWTISHQHTGVTDLPLTPEGEAEARRLRGRLEGLAFAAVLTSPLRRAVRTCELAGYGPAAEIDADLVEWNYGAYEGRTSAEIHAERPDWQLSRRRPGRGVAGADRGLGRPGHSPDPSRRREHASVLERPLSPGVRGALAGLEPGAGKYLFLGTASLSALGYEHDHSDPVIRLWDETPPEPPVRRAPGRARRGKAPR